MRRAITRPPKKIRILSSTYISQSYLRQFSHLMALNVCPWYSTLTALLAMNRARVVEIVDNVKYARRGLQRSAPKQSQFSSSDTKQTNQKRTSRTLTQSTSKKFASTHKMARITVGCLGISLLLLIQFYVLHVVFSRWCVTCRACCVCARATTTTTRTAELSLAREFCADVAATFWGERVAVVRARGAAPNGCRFRC